LHLFHYNAVIWVIVGNIQKRILGGANSVQNKNTKKTYSAVIQWIVLPIPRRIGTGQTERKMMNDELQTTIAVDAVGLAAPHHHQPLFVNSTP
jgi:hypothetical protein